MNKIVVIGANQCALVFAELAANAGFDVTLYEKKSKSGVAYDWTDDMAPETFGEIGLPLPPDDIYYRKRPWAFVSPQKECSVLLDMPENELDISVARRPLNDWLEARALTAGAKIFYGIAAKAALAAGRSVKGIILEDGTEVCADLTVDCGGISSAVRQSLPSEFKIPAAADLKNAFYVRRAFFARPDGTDRPEYTNKAYLKHIGEAGISWCILSHDETEADVLIGRVGKMSDETYKNALADLRLDNDIIGETLVGGGELLTIPVRRPISRMTAEGYALLGDSAYMTIPMLGSGIASGMKAAKILTEVISKPSGDAFSMSNLYRYQKRFMNEIGAKHAAVDLMKNWLLNSREGEVDFLLSSKVVDEKQLKQGATGEMMTLSFSELIDKAVKGRKNLPLLIRLSGLLVAMKRQYRLASSLPREYDEDRLLLWQKKYSSAYGDEF